MSRRRRSRDGPVDRAELEGYLAGVSRRVAEAPDSLRAGLSELLAHAHVSFQSGDLARARSELEAIDDRISAANDEPELSEFPRGLVDYAPIGSRGTPRPDEEDPVANRLRLLGRLLALRRSRGREIDPLLTRLREAEAALRSGDRARARAIGDEVQDALEEEGSRAPQA